MQQLYVFGIVIQLLTIVIAQQRVPPGVNPQHYQTQAQPQYQQQAQPQYQQQQQPQHQQQYQQQQPQQPQQPQQQQQYQPQQTAGSHQHQQAPAQHGHHQQPVLTGNVQDEKAHIAEHLEVPMDTSKMSEQELQFHYFKMHDADNNNKLDGCELIKSLIHWHAQGSKEQHNSQQPHLEEKIFTEEELVLLIDPILQMDDTSRDGFIDYPEFVKAQQKAAANTQQHQNP